MVMCGPGDIVTPDIAPFIYTEGLVLFFIEFGCYVVIWIIILIKNSSQGKKSGKIINDILLILKRWHMQKN
ncbi:unnamed protein product [Meloidogyne enterolobii]|uniref:Uncharacterized protein n=1 Tax=Meloidogyne enterolobii TaxID=390850 RepID=A0ACB1AMC9_MELEN